MKNYEIKQMSKDEMIKRIDEEEQNLIDLRFTHQLKQLTNTAKIKLVRRDIARMKTIVAEKNKQDSNSENNTKGAKA